MSLCDRPKLKAQRATLPSSAAVPVATVIKVMGASAMAVPVVSTVSPEAMDQEQSTTFEHVISVESAPK